MSGLLAQTRALCGGVGESGIGQLRKLTQLASLAAGVLGAVTRRSTWRPTLRRPLVRQIMSSGVEATPLVTVLAVSLGVLLVAQYQLWLGAVVESRWLGPLLIAVVVRELGPIVVNLVVIARSGGTMAAELALVHVTGEDRVVAGQGIDPVAYYIVPRVLALIVSVVCLTTLLFAFSFIAVYVVGQWIGAKTGSFTEFMQGALGALTLSDAVSLTLKSTVPPLLTGCICCIEGFGAADNIAGVPAAARRAVQRAVIALFAVIALISVAVYL